MPASLTPSQMHPSMPESTDALLALGDMAFVKAAYLTLQGPRQSPPRVDQLFRRLHGALLRRTSSTT